MKNSKNILIIVSALVVAGGAYWYFFTGTGNQAPLTTTTATSQAQTTFQTLVSELQPISFDTTILSDPRFRALVDITTPVSPEPSGRTDPFATVAGVSGK
jgi:hypothetical protein